MKYMTIHIILLYIYSHFMLLYTLCNWLFVYLSFFLSLSIIMVFFCIVFKLGNLKV